MKEQWKNIIGYEGYYQVSNFGNIKSLSRTIIKDNGQKYLVKEKILKPGIGSHGYYIVVLIIKNKRSVKRVHSLVAIAFLNHNPCGHDLVINHKNFNRLDNNLKNLEIISHRANSNLKHYKSSSKYTGVSWDKHDKKWKASISVNNKLINLGRYKDEYKAHLAYQNKLEQLTNKLKTL